jgi:hypothetical protein
VKRCDQVREWIAEWIRATSDPECAQILTWDVPSGTRWSYGYGGEGYEYTPDPTVEVVYRKAGTQGWEWGERASWTYCGTLEGLLCEMDERDRRNA